MSNVTTGAPRRLLRVSDIIGSPRRGIKPLIPVSRTTLFTWEKSGQFPASASMGPLKVWDEDQIKQWIADRLSGVPMPDDDRRVAILQAANMKRSVAMRAHRAKEAVAEMAQAAQQTATSPFA